MNEFNNGKQFLSIFLLIFKRFQYWSLKLHNIIYSTCQLQVPALIVWNMEYCKTGLCEILWFNVRIYGFYRIINWKPRYAQYTVSLNCKLKGWWMENNIHTFIMMFVIQDNNIENGFSVFSVQQMNDKCNFNWKYFIMNKYCCQGSHFATRNSQLTASPLFWAENQLIPISRPSALLCRQFQNCPFGQCFHLLI